MNGSSFTIHFEVPGFVCFSSTEQLPNFGSKALAVSKRIARHWNMLKLESKFFFELSDYGSKFFGPQNWWLEWSAKSVVFPNGIGTLEQWWLDFAFFCWLSQDSVKWEEGASCFTASNCFYTTPTKPTKPLTRVKCLKHIGKYRFHKQTHKCLRYINTSKSNRSSKKASDCWHGIAWICLRDTHARTSNANSSATWKSTFSKGDLAANTSDSWMVLWEWTTHPENQLILWICMIYKIWIYTSYMNIP